MDLLNKTVTYQVKTVTKVNGMDKSIYTNSFTFQAHIWQLNETQSLRYSKPDFIATHKLFTNNTTLNILEGNRIVLDNINYQILSVDNPHNLNHHLIIIVSRLNG